MTGTRATSIRPVGNYLEGLNYDSRQAIGNLEKVIGRLPNQHDYNYTGHQARTFGDLTELLIERAPRVVKAQVTGLLEKSYISPYTTILLPIREMGEMESLNVTWTEINFNPGFVDQVEVLGLGRYFTHNKTKRGATAVRRGAAIKIESGFFMTAEGREEWSMQIEQLATAIQETNEYDVLMTLLQVPMRQEIHAQDMNGPYNHMFYGAKPDMTYSERLVLMRDMFSIVNKTPDSRGFSGMVTNLKTIMERNGSGADTIVVPPYMVGFFHYTKDDLWQAQSAGPAAAQANRDVATDIGGQGPLRLQTIQGMKIVDTHVYRPVKGARSSANDLLTVPVQIGEFYPMCIDMIYRDNISFENYRSSDRDVEIFNEGQGRFVPIYFMDALKHTFRWKGDPNDPGEFDGALHERHGLSGSGGGEIPDMFNNGGSVAATWGDMHKKGLSDDSVLRVVHSIKGNVFSKDSWDEYSKACASNLTSEQQKENLKALKDGTPVPNAVGTVADEVKFNEFIAKLDDLFHIESDATFKASAKTGFTNSLGVGHFNNTNPASYANRSDAVFRASADSTTRIVAAAFLHSKVDYNVLKSLHEANVYVPVDIILARPWMTYYASTVIVMRSGTDTGETVIGRQDFQMSANTSTRELEASMVYYGKAIVRNSRNVMVAPHVFIQSYIGGNDVNWVGNDGLNEIEQMSGIIETKESLIAMLVPAGCRVHNESWIDYRGENPETGDKEFHASTEYYKEVFKTTEAEIYTPTETFVDYEAQTYPVNSICWHGHINYGKEFKRQALCQGHLGTTTVDQVNNSRKEGCYSPIRSLHFNVNSR